MNGRNWVLTSPDKVERPYGLYRFFPWLVGLSLWTGGDERGVTREEAVERGVGVESREAMDCL